MGDHPLLRSPRSQCGYVDSVWTCFFSAHCWEYEFFRTLCESLNKIGVVDQFRTLMRSNNPKESIHITVSLGYIPTSVVQFSVWNFSTFSSMITLFYYVDLYMPINVTASFMSVIIFLLLLFSRLLCEIWRWRRINAVPYAYSAYRLSSIFLGRNRSAGIDDTRAIFNE